MVERKMSVPEADPPAAPVVKWAGGKRQLLGCLVRRVPQVYSRYYEPFFGGGALLWRLRPEKAVVNDVNADLMNLYRVIRDALHPLMEELERYRNEESFYYRLRELDRDREAYGALTDVCKAARILYLNRTCYNGLFRVNSAGEFNTPFGRYKNPKIADWENLYAVHRFLNRSKVKLLCGDYEASLRRLDKDAFVYFDPPYDPLSASAGFTGYDRGGFDRSQQQRLKNVCDRLHKRGIRFLLSNSSTDFIRNLYGAYEIETVRARRALNSKGEKRGAVAELLIRNYIR